MNKTISRCLIICVSSVLTVLSVATPWVLDSHNLILDAFISQGGLLSFLGVLVTITLASAANLHLELSKMEQRIKKEVFQKTRCAIKKSSYWLIIMLVFAIILISVKSLAAESDIYLALVNSGCLIILVFNILVLSDITQTIYAIRPNFD